MLLETRALIPDLFVPQQAEPLESIEDGARARFGAARPIGVLDAQQELAVVVLREQPIEKGSARAADVEIPGGRGGESKSVHAGKSITPLVILRSEATKDLLFIKSKQILRCAQD